MREKHYVRSPLLKRKLKVQNEGRLAQAGRATNVARGVWTKIIDF